MADSNSLDAPWTTSNDPPSTVKFAAEVALASNSADTWRATAGPGDSAVRPRAASSSTAAHTSSFNTQPTSVSPVDTIDDLRAVQGTRASRKKATRSRALVVDRPVLDSMMHLPRKKAAQVLGLCSTTFKKVCRRAGLHGWPYRRPLLGFTPEGSASTPSSTGGFSQPSPIQETPASASDNASGSFRSIDAAAAMMSAPMGLTTIAVAAALHASAERSCDVVDAVMDYLDTLSSGAASFGELEAVVAAMDLFSPASGEAAGCYRGTSPIGEVQGFDVKG